MTKKRTALVVVPLVLLAFLAILFVACLFGDVDIDRSTYDRIHLGMTDEEVCAAVGYPPGDHCRGFQRATGFLVYDGSILVLTFSKLPDGILSFSHPITGAQGSGKWWCGQKGSLLVFFGDDGRVIERKHIECVSHGRVEWFFQRLCKALGL